MRQGARLGFCGARRRLRASATARAAAVSHGCLQAVGRSFGALAIVGLLIASAVGGEPINPVQRDPRISPPTEESRNTIYDPSYGTAQPDTQTWEDESIAGICGAEKPADTPPAGVPPKEAWSPVSPRPAEWKWVPCRKKTKGQREMNYCAATTPIEDCRNQP